MTRAITSIDEQAWTPIHYPNAIYDDDEQRWVSDAEVAEIGFTAFTSRRKAEHVTARLIVRRVRRLNPKTVPAGQSARLFAVYRYHAVFTDSPEPMLAAEATHRDHAIVEQVIADLKNGPLAHLPSGLFTANAAWLVCAAIAHNLTRAAGALAGGRHARARTATIRAHLINTPARIAHSAHRHILHLPRDWPWRARPRRTVPPRPARPAPHTPPDHPARQGPTGDHSGRAGQTGSTNHARHTAAHTHKDQLGENRIHGGSRLSPTIVLLYGIDAHPSARLRRAGDQRTASTM